VCADGDSTELMRLTKEAIHDDLAENADREAEATAKDTDD
jgi:hypothetical protein